MFDFDHGHIVFYKSQKINPKRASRTHFSELCGLSFTITTRRRLKSGQETAPLPTRM
ncbi:hypothetical protein EMIT0P265_70351 [Pseudomonas zeae]